MVTNIYPWWRVRGSGSRFTPLISTHFPIRLVTMLQSAFLARLACGLWTEFFVFSLNIQFTIISPQKKVERLKWPYGNCLKDGRLKDFLYPSYNYSMEVDCSLNYENKWSIFKSSMYQGCLRSCFQKMLVNNCNCSDAEFPTLKNVPYCAVNDSAASDVSVSNYLLANILFKKSCMFQDTV